MLSWWSWWWWWKATLMTTMRPKTKTYNVIEKVHWHAAAEDALSLIKFWSGSLTDCLLHAALPGLPCSAYRILPCTITIRPFTGTKSTVHSRDFIANKQEPGPGTHLGFLSPRYIHIHYINRVVSASECSRVLLCLEPRDKYSNNNNLISFRFHDNLVIRSV